MNDAPGGRVGEVSEPSKATSPSALPWEREPSLAGLWTAGERWGQAGGQHGHLWEHQAWISECLCLEVGMSMGFLGHLLCALIQTSKPFSFTIDCFYNGFLLNVPSLLFLIRKLYLIARFVIC